MNKEIYKGYKIRIFPNKEQEEKIKQHIGSCRFIWNYMLNLQEENYKNGGKFLKHFDMNLKLTELKKLEDFKWLNEISTSTLQYICKDVYKAYKSFFNKQKGHPRFKSKKTAKKAYPIRNDRFYLRDKNHFQITKLGSIKFKSDIEFPIGNHNIKIWNGRISEENDKWYLSFQLQDEVDYESQVIEDISDKSLIGIDLGVKELATVAFNDDFIVYHNINKSKKMKNLEKRRNYYEKSVSRKYRTNGNWEKSNNIIKTEAKVRKIYKKQRDIRKNYIHQVTNDIIKLKPDRIVMEDLRVRNLMKNKHLSKSIQESTFGGFIETMKYKCEWNNIEFRQVPSNYPSSKTCSCCGSIKKDLKLKDRIYICPECGFEMDRDMNAARNLMNYNFD